MKNVYDSYREKLRTPDEAVKIVKSGDWVDYTTNVGFPVLLDEALAKRKDELYDVKIRGNLMFGPLKAVECDPTREHFMYNSWHYSAYERHLSDRGLCNFIPMIFRNLIPYYRHFLTVNVAMIFGYGGLFYCFFFDFRFTFGDFTLCNRCRNRHYEKACSKSSFNTHCKRTSLFPFYDFDDFAFSPF